MKISLVVVLASLLFSLNALRGMEGSSSVHSYVSATLIKVKASNSNKIYELPQHLFSVLTNCARDCADTENGQEALELAMVSSRDLKATEKWLKKDFHHIPFIKKLRVLKTLNALNYTDEQSLKNICGEVGEYLSKVSSAKSARNCIRLLQKHCVIPVQKQLDAYFPHSLMHQKIIPFLLLDSQVTNGKKLVLTAKQIPVFLSGMIAIDPCTISHTSFKIGGCDYKERLSFMRFDPEIDQFVITHQKDFYFDESQPALFWHPCHRNVVALKRDKTINVYELRSNRLVKCIAVIHPPCPSTYNEITLYACCWNPIDKNRLTTIDSYNGIVVWQLSEKDKDNDSSLKPPKVIFNGKNTKKPLFAWHPFDKDLYTVTDEQRIELQLWHLAESPRKVSSWHMGEKISAIAWQRIEPYYVAVSTQFGTHVGQMNDKRVKELYRLPHPKVHCEGICWNPLKKNCLALLLFMSKVVPVYYLKDNGKFTVKKLSFELKEKIQSNTKIEWNPVHPNYLVAAVNSTIKIWFVDELKKSYIFKSELSPGLYAETIQWSPSGMHLIVKDCFKEKNIHVVTMGDSNLQAVPILNRMSLVEKLMVWYWLKGLLADANYKTSAF